MKKLILLLLLSIFILAACDQSPQTAEGEVSSEETIIKNEGDFTTIAPQPTSPIRGVYTNTSNNMSLDSMEEGLQDIVATYLDPADYVYSPGQVITAEEAQMLVGRELTEEQFNEVLKSYPEAENIGLNPVLKDGANPAESKTYVNTIIEQDYYAINADGTKTLDTIAIGFGIDPIYEYTYKGEEYEVEISMDELNEYANNLIGSKMDDFIRGKEEYKDVTIVYGFYLQSDSELYPGVYYAKGISTSGETPIQYETLDNENVLFPSADGEELNKQLNTDVQKILTESENYFPVSTGAYCYGEYKNGELVQLHFDVILNSYSSLDVSSYMNYMEGVINQTSIANYDYVVEIQAPQGIPLGLMEQKGDEVYKYVY